MQEPRSYLTDPPYGMGFKWSGVGMHQYNGTTKSHHEKWKGKTIVGDSKPNTEFLKLWVEKIMPAGALYLFSIWSVDDVWRTSIIDNGLKIKNRVVWAKNYQGAGDLEGSYGPQSESIFFAIKEGHALRGKRIGDVWTNEDKTGCIRHGKLHPTEKPVDLLIIPISHSSDSGGLIADPFLGSGTTLIACENTGRKCRGIEISPEYCAVVLERFKEATGKEPVRING